ncbi:MAG TPA: hypothetical protein VIJ62_15065 [Rhizomicrobium sp.]
MFSDSDSPTPALLTPRQAAQRYPDWLVFENEALLTPREFLDRLHNTLSVLAETVRSPEPFMVDRTEAARRCGMSVATYDKYASKGLLPRMNATRRVSLEALKRACLQLDGIAERAGPADDAERALREWESA